MARTTKDGSVRGAKPVSEAVKRPQTMIIPARELVQVIAKVLLRFFQSSLSFQLAV